MKVREIDMKKRVTNKQEQVKQEEKRGTNKQEQVKQKE